MVKLKPMPFLIVGIAAFFVLPALSIAQPTNYVDPSGYPAAWPSQLTTQAYTAKGNSQFDLTGNSDDSRGAALSGSVDFSSGSSNDQPSIFFYSDGSILYFRLRVDGPPVRLTGNGEPFTSETWNLLLDTDGDGYKEFVIMLEGGDSNSEPDDIVVIYDDANTQQWVINQDGIWRQDAAVGNDSQSDGETGDSDDWDTDSDQYVWDWGRTRVTQISQSGQAGKNDSEYFIDIQVPIAALDASGISGPTMTANSPFTAMATSSNSNTDPTQKDVIYAGDLTVSNVALPGGDIANGNGQILQAPVIPSIVNTVAAPKDTITVTVVDVIDVSSGVAVDTIDSVRVEYYLDVNENELADDAGQSWQRVGLASRVSGALGKWRSVWDYTGLEGQYFILRAVATDLDGNTTQSTDQSSLSPSSVTSTVYTLSESQQQSGVSDVTVTVANPLKGATSQYNVTFTTTEELRRKRDDIRITFPAGTIPATIDKDDVKVNNEKTNKLYISGQTFTIRVYYDVDPGSVTVTFRDSPGVVNPQTAGFYTLDLSTSKEAVIVASNPYEITSSAPLTSATLTPTSSIAGNASGYRLQFALGSAGALTASSGTFTIVFPNDTAVPEGLIYGTTVQGVPAAAIGTAATRTIQVETPVSLTNLETVIITFAASSGLVNPTTAATYTLTVATSAETSPVTSNSYTVFTGTSLTPASVGIAPNTVNTVSEYTVSAQLGSSGELTGGTDHIFLDFPENTVVPSAIATNDILVDNGTFAAPPTSVTTTTASGQITIVPSQDIPSGASVTVIIKPEAGVVNPILAKNHFLQMATSQEDTVGSNSYLTLAATSTVTPATVVLSDKGKNDNSRYTLTFDVGAQGRLLGGTSTITVAFPGDTDVPSSISSSNVTVNGTASADVTTDEDTRLVTVKVPSGVSIGNNGAVTLVIGSSSEVIANPNANITVAVQVSTSVEENQISSLNYEIGSGGSDMTFDSIELGVSAANTVSSYTIIFETGSKNIDAKKDHIILTFPANTTIPASIATSNVRIVPDADGDSDDDDDEEDAYSVTTSPAAYQINVVPEDKLDKQKHQRIRILTGAGVINPSVPKTTYTMALRQTDEAYDVTSPQYTVTAAATSVSVGTITVSPTRTGEAAGYRIPITLGASGELLLGSSTITITFPTGTTIPATIPANTMRVNDTAPTTVSTNPSARTVTITTPVSVASGGAVTVISAVASGITNPASGSHTLQVQTSTETSNSTSASYTITADTALAVTSALPNPSAINANAGYVIVFKVGSGSALSIGDQITVDFDDLTGVPALMAAADVRVNEVAATVAPFTDVVSKQVTVTTPVAVAGNGEVSLAFTNAAGLRNPPTAGSYELTVGTNVQPTAQTSPSYTITPMTTSVSAASVTPSLGTVSQLASYTIAFNTGAQGALEAGAGTITITFNDSTTLGTIVSGNVTVNGVEPQAVGPSGQNLTITVPPGVNIGNSGDVTVVIGSATAVITNPSTAGDYTVTAKTSVESAAVTSLSYPIGSATTTVSPATVTVTPSDVAAVAAYTVQFNVGSSGALSSGSGTITLKFPDNTSVPFSIAASDITVNSTTVVASPVVSPTGRTVTITTPVNVANDGAVTVVIASDAGLRNPTSAGGYTLQVHTSAEVTKVNSLAYTIGPSATTVTAANVTPTANGVNTAAQYVIGFRVGASGSLAAGASTITLTMPTGTTVPASIAPSKVTINGSAASAVSVSGQQITITVPVAVTISNSDSVTIVISEQAQVQNPQILGQYALQVQTSAEPSAVASNPYTIAASATSVTAASVTPNPATTGVTAAYTIQFNTGASGALQPGTSSITVTFNSSTTVNTQAISGATVNGVGATAAGDAATRTVFLTVPASVTIGNSDLVTVVIPSGIVKNPGSAGTNTLEVKTSVEGTNVTSNGYAVTAATTTVTAATVTPDPANANVTAQYTIAFNTGADGPLTAGSGTVTITFPNNTILPASITPADITVNTTAVSASVTVDQTLRTVTFTTPVNVSASSAVSVVFLSAVGLTNPSTGTFTVQVRTSVEATNIASNGYTITAATTNAAAPTVSVTPDVVETIGAYTISFTVGSSGRLLSGVSTITVTFPSGTTVPASITASTVSVNGVAASVVTVSGQAVTITVPGSITINNSTSVVVVVNTGAGVFNPSTIASYTLTVHTSTETGAQTSGSYVINASSTSTSPAMAVPSPGQQSSTAQYLVSFTTGGLGALQPGVSTVTATFPVGTTVPSSIATSNVTVNGVNTSAVVTTPASRIVTVTVPASVSIGNNDAVSVVIGSGSNVLTSPTAGLYTLTVRTSVEQADVTSNTYQITSASTQVDSAFVGPVAGGASPGGGPSPQGVNTIGAYNVKFKLGGQGALTAGTSKITLTFPAYTTVPTSIVPSLITVNGTTVTASPECNALLRTITITVPSGTTDIAATDTVQVNISADALIRNPLLAGTHRLDVRTSVEATNVPSKQYTITAAATTVSAATVIPTPNTFGQNARYRIDVSTGSQGALVGGTSTLLLTFPSGTTVPSSIDASDVTINGVATPTVVTDSGSRQVTVTVPASVSIGNNGVITLIFSASAGLVNPSPGTITLQVRSSAETTDVASNGYTIESLSSIQTKSTLSLFPVWSPSDTRMVYIAEGPEDGSGAGTGNWNLFTISKDGASKVQVTSAFSGGTIEDGDPLHFSWPTWNSDGDSVVYVGYERVIIPPDTNLTLQIFQIHKDGGAIKKLSPSGAVEDSTQQFGGWLDPDWKLTTFSFENAQFPNGVDRIAASLDGNIWVFEPYSTLDGPESTFKNLVQVTDLPVSTTKTDGLFQPKWSPDGAKLAVVYKDSSSATLSDIYVIDNMESILQKTLESSNFSTGSFDYDTVLGSSAVNELSDMTKITPSGNTFPSWTPSWSADGTEIAYSQDQANALNLDTFSSNPSSAVGQTNFYVKLRSADGTGTDSTLIGIADANNAFPEMSNNGQRFVYFQAATTGEFSQTQKVLYLQTTGDFEPPGSSKVLAKKAEDTWKLTDYGYSSLEFPVTAVSQPARFYILEPEDIRSEELVGTRYTGVARTFGPAEAPFLEPASVTVHYTSGEIAEAGLIEKTGQEERLRLYFWNEETQVWDPVENSTVDTENNLVSAPVTKLGTFGVFYQNPGAGQLLSQMMVYPNPFRPNSGNTNDGDYTTGIIFDLLPTGLSRLDLYNVAGEQVASLDGNGFEVISPTQLRWLVTSNSGRRVASGIYIYVMEAVNAQGETERKMGKIGVIR